MVPGRFKSLTKAWTTAGVDEAATKIVTEDSSLMSSLMGKINNDLKAVRKEKSVLMDKIVNVMDEDDADAKSEITRINRNSN